MSPTRTFLEGPNGNRKRSLVLKRANDVNMGRRARITVATVFLFNAN